MPDPAPFPADEIEDPDDALAERLADILVERVTAPDADPAERRAILNRLRDDAGLPPIKWEATHEEIARLLRLGVRTVRTVEAIALEKIRDRLNPTQDPTP